MGVIFWFSHQDATASSHTSHQVLQFLLKLFGIDPSNTLWIESFYWETITFILRKCAHFFVFTVLGFLVFHAVRAYPDTTQLQRIGLPLVIGLVYACIDELHQFFIPGRACQLRDVCIDTAGVLCGILLCLLLHRLSHKKWLRHSSSISSPTEASVSE